jgi:16S rRNA (adenine1518-N6/adenine1519-N6)-dimethyltransferase
MQTVTEIRQLLRQAGLRPNQDLGQCFLIDQNHLAKVVDLAEISADRQVLEVGPGTGTLTEELLDRARRVLAAEIDRGLCALLTDRLGPRENFELFCGDVLAGKKRLNPSLAERLGPDCDQVSNLPYNIATPLVLTCLRRTWLARIAQTGAVGFDRQTFTVQREQAERFTASPGSKVYGPAGVWIQLTCRVQQGPLVPPTAFWPRPRIESRILRLDFQPDRAGRIEQADALDRVLGILFAQRRKQVGKLARQAGKSGAAPGLADAIADAGIDPTFRAEQLDPDQLLDLANRLARAERA